LLWSYITYTTVRSFDGLQQHKQAEVMFIGLKILQRAESCQRKVFAPLAAHFTLREAVLL